MVSLGLSILTAVLLLTPLNELRDPGDALDKSIDRALVFLERMQESDGSWRAGRYNKHAGITGLAVMAFLSAGHVPGEGPYGETVERGIRWVLNRQQANGLIATEGHHEMYHHGICTLMLAEVVGMTDGRLAGEVRAALEKAVAVILRAQRPAGMHRGGWRYRLEGNDADISVSGWQVMALRAAKNLGCDVPPEAIERAIEYVKRCYDPATGGYRYYPGGPLTVACTGTSILALELCGKQQHGAPELLKAGGFLLRNPPRWGHPHFFYAIYYCSQAAFQLGDNYWTSFRPKLHEVLFANQADNGCWSASQNEGRTYGPSYCTAMAVLALTVEYRYLPIYQRGEEPADKLER